MNLLLPLVSILLPIRNESAFLKGCLESILAQDYPAEKIEIIAADGMSEDNTREILRQFFPRAHSLRVIDNPGRIVPTGMNRAIALCAGEIILRVDGHCEIAPDYVRNCVRHLQEDGVQGVGGPMRTIGKTRLAETIAVAMSSPFGVGNSAFRTTSGKSQLADTVPFPAYTRAVVEQAGPYDEELVRNQDDEYNYRIRALGGRLLLAEDVRSVYYSRASLGGLWRQYFQYGFYKVRVLQKHPRQMSARQFVPPLFVTDLLIGLLLTLLFPWGWIVLGLVGGSYLLANLAAAIYTAAKHGWRHLALLPPTFAILHVGYGLGFLAGLVKFSRRWSEPGTPPEAIDEHAGD